MFPILSFNINEVPLGKSALKMLPATVTSFVEFILFNKKYYQVNPLNESNGTNFLKAMQLAYFK